MLRNPSPIFIGAFMERLAVGRLFLTFGTLAEATSSKFLSAVEEVVTKSTTTPVVKARVLEVLSGAAHAYPGLIHSTGPLEAFKRDKGGGYGMLWRKVKPSGYPDEVSKLSTQCYQANSHLLTGNTF